MPHTLVGRDDDLAVLADAWATAVHGEPTVVLVGGYAGVGKTELMRTFAADHADRGRVVTTRATRSGAERPCWVVLTALRDQAALDADRRREIDGLLVPSAAPSVPGALDAARRAVGDLATDRPTLLVIDDLHHADAATLDLIPHLTAGERRVLVVATYRTEAVTPGRPFCAALAALRSDRRVRLHDLAPLDRPAVTAMVQALVGDAPADLVALAWNRSHGNPFVVHATVRAGGATIPTALRHLLLADLHELATDARAVVRALAPVDGPVAHAVLAAVAGVAAPDLPDALRDAVDVGAVVVDDAGVALRHGLLREALAGHLLPTERHTLHRRYGAALESVDAAGAARHWCLAGEPTRALPLLVGAAEQAGRDGDFAAAQGLGTRALELFGDVTDSGIERTALLERVAADAHHAGDHDTACRLTRELLGETPPGGAEAARRTAALVRRLLAADRSRDALDTARDAVGLLGDGVLVAHAEALLADTRDAEAREVAERALALVEGAERARALAVLGVATARLEGTGHGLTALHEGLDAAERAGSPAEIAVVHAHLAEVLVGPLGELDEGIAVARRGADRAAEIGLARTVGARLLATLAGALHHLGRWDEAVEAVECALAPDPGPVDAAAAHLVRARVRLDRGEIAAATADLEAADRAAGTRRRGAALRADLALAAGRPAEARRLVRQGLDGATPELLAPLLWTGLRAEVEIAAAIVPAPRPPVDEPHPFRLLVQHLDLLDHRAPRGRTVHAAWVALCRAEESRVLGRSDATAWTACADAWAAARRPHQEAYCLFRRGEALLAERSRSSAATDALRRARRGARTLGAAPLVEEIEELAGRGRITLDVDAVPEPTPSPGRPDLAGLTAREQDVLGEIARGLTNREIGERLYISEKTVGVHVTHILAKLGARTRVEASAVLHRARRAPP